MRNWRFKGTFSVKSSKTSSSTTLRRERDSWQCKVQHLAWPSLCPCYDDDADPDALMIIILIMMLMIMRAAHLAMLARSSLQDCQNSVSSEPGVQILDS